MVVVVSEGLSVAAVYISVASDHHIKAARRPVGRVLAPRESAVCPIRSHDGERHLIVAVVAEHTADVGR